MICARECAREPTAKEIGLSQVAGSTRRPHRSESFEKRHSTRGPGSRACVCHPSLERHPSRRYNIVCIRIAIKCGLRLTSGELGSVAWPAGDLVYPHNQGCLKIIASDTTGVLPAPCVEAPMSGDGKEPSQRRMYCERRVADDKAIYTKTSCPAQHPEASLLASRGSHSLCTHASGVHLRASFVRHHPHQHQQQQESSNIFLNKNKFGTTGFLLGLTGLPFIRL